MKFAEYIKEQLTTYTTIRIIKDSHKDFFEEFQVDDVLYKIYCEMQTDVWDIRIDAIADFKEKKPHAAVVLTNPSTVLSNLIKCVDLFLEKKDPQGFVVITKNDSMKRVLNRILPELKKTAIKRKQYYHGRTSVGYTHKFTFNKEQKEDK